MPAFDGRREINMTFDYIPKVNIEDHTTYNIESDSFYRFIDEFNIDSVKWAEPLNISASYFLRLLQSGSTQRSRKGDEWNGELNDFRDTLLDHCALWRQKNGSVFCTAMPYSNQATIINAFNKMRQIYNYPNTIKLDFLNDKYKYRPSGSCMIMIYCNETSTQYSSNCTIEELQKKIVMGANPVNAYSKTTINTYIRDKYISEFTKKRAKGICQLCNKPAPFEKNGQPYLESHHVIWLADGGEDSLDNTVALCPNCHKKMHILNLEEDVRKLLAVAKSFNYDGV